ncbi:ATP-binding protein [Streptomyces sp. NPDC058268]|uniref:ATP-binding protein n=1 Tax=Streptomyces sp. NPDC058268 TaxID=3346413 RepID=UPI0036ED38FF
MCISHSNGNSPGPSDLSAKPAPSPSAPSPPGGVVDRHDEIKLCVSELATNALLHGVPKGRAFEVSFLISTDEAELRVEVRDSGDGRLVATAPTGDACTGRGLHLARELADDFGVIEHVVGKTVWLTFKALHLPAVPHRSGGPSSPDRHEG